VFFCSLYSGALTTLYNNDADFHAKYLKKFPGYYHTGDTGHIDEDGYVYVGLVRDGS
jgi:propionyl-CoA synthetase